MIIIILAVIVFVYLVYLYQKIKDLQFYKSRKQFEKNDRIRLHMVSETAWVTQGQGVHTAFIELLELLKEDARIDIVVNNDGGGNVFHSHTYGPYYFWKGLGYKGRRILTAHVIPDSSKGTIPFWKQLLPITTLYLKMAYNYADVVIAISPTVEAAIRQMGVRSKIVRIYNPVLTENWKPRANDREKGRKLLNIGQSEKVVMGVGQLQQRKGVEDFIDIAEAMPDVRFVWVGGRPWGKFTEGIKRIDERIKNAPANIQFTGLLELEEMPVMYATGDVFLFPSYQENCPLAPIEAAASGMPVVYRDIPEYKQLYKSAYLKAVSTGDFINITQKLFADDTFYNAGVSISNDLLKGFDKNSVKNELISLYSDVLNEHLISAGELAGRRL